MEATLALEEVSIIASVRAGNHDAFGDIVDRYQEGVQRYLLRLTGDYELAKDITQDTFIQAYKSVLKTNSEYSLKAWLYSIASNNFRQYYRRKTVLSFVPLSGLEKSDSRASSEDSTDRDMAIQEALLRVPEMLRESLTLHFVEGFKYREIAEVLGISEEAVRKRVARGSREFRRLYGPGGEER
jgi:RNA polymerase sigma-70 factor (ECF subfamily)